MFEEISFVFSGITTDGRLFRLSNFTINNTVLDRNGKDIVAPSDIPQLLHKFLDKNREECGKADAVYVDSVDQATMSEIYKYKQLYGSIYEFVNSYKKVTRLDRITLMIGWMARLLMQHSL